MATAPKGFNLSTLTDIGAAEAPSKGIDIRASLDVENPKQGDVKIDYRHDRLMRVAIDRVDSFEHNPRRKRTEEDWNYLKDSIRAIGIENPVKVTQRPGSDRYEICSGGNSRLAILKELYQETNDEKFAAIPVIFVAFSELGDADISMMLKHIVENDIRSDVVFWDKANSYHRLAELMGIDENSTREISDTFRSRGASVSHNNLSLYFFANSKLKELGQLCYDLSGPKTIELRKAYYELQKLVANQDAEFDEFWSNTLQTFSDANSLHSDGDGTSNTSPIEPTLNVPALLKAIRKDFFEQFPEAALKLIQQKAKLPSTPTNLGLDASANKVQHTETEDNKNSEVLEPSPSQQHVEVVGTAVSGVSQQNILGSTSIPTSSTIVNLEQFTQTNYEDRTLHELVIDLLKYCGIEQYFREAETKPFQFYLELPDISDHFDGEFYPIDRIHPYARDVWWMLASICRQIDPMEDAYFDIPNESLFMQVFSDTPRWQSYISEHLGPQTPFAMENWYLYSPDEKFIQLLNDVLKRVREINQTDLQNEQN